MAVLLQQAPQLPALQTPSPHHCVAATLSQEDGGGDSCHPQALCQGRPLALLHGRQHQEGAEAVEGQAVKQRHRLLPLPQEEQHTVLPRGGSGQERSHSLGGQDRGGGQGGQQGGGDVVEQGGEGERAPVAPQAGEGGAGGGAQQDGGERGSKAGLPCQEKEEWALLIGLHPPQPHAALQLGS